MKRNVTAACLAALLIAGPQALLPGAARACGFGEAPTACDEGSAEAEARWMLRRVVAALERDKPGALRQFARGEGGFRTADTYVFCIGPDGVMTAHPSAILQGQDVRELHDETGNYFVRTMMEQARPGEVKQISYLFPRPGSTRATPKTSFYTRASDQVCGVGIYDGDERTTAPATARERVATRLAQLRQRLDDRVPAELRADWTAFLEALDEQDGQREALLARVRERADAIQAALADAGRRDGPR